MPTVKYNDATLNRPQGERVIDAEYVFSDIPAFTQHLKEEKAWRESSQNAMTIFKTEGITIVLMALKKDANILSNQLDELLVIHALEGEIDVFLDGGEVQVAAGQMLTLHAGVKHSIAAKAESLLLLSTFTPAGAGDIQSTPK